MKPEHPAIPFLGRLLIIHIFVTGGISKATDWSGNLQYMESHHLPLVPLLLHNYWAVSGPTAGILETHFRKNLAIMGGLLILVYAGPGRWAVGHTDKEGWRA